MVHPAPKLASRVTTIIALYFLASAARVSAHSPVDYLEVYTVSASVPVEHAVELECGKILGRQHLNLAGPAMFASAVGGNGKAAPKQKVLLNWYEIQDEVSGHTSNIEVLDFVRGGSTTKLSISSVPKYFLCGAQQLVAGEPDPIPEGLDQYLAFPIVDGEKLGRSMELIGSQTQRQKATIAAPAYLCIAAKEWHHDETFEVSHRLTCFVVFEVDSTKVAGGVANTLDQFGLNQLKLEESKWLASRGAILERDD